ncbi:MAG: NUDIX hydrolase [Bdellovibrionales bacterium]|nr:NUDIX hydrolase [Bdellovibrionales bacterium]
MTKIQAVTIVIEKDGRFLLGKRSAWKTSAPGYWCPVSGRIEAGETEREAVRREAFEEVGLTVEPLKKLCRMDTRDGSGELHWWTVSILVGEAFLKNDEHSEIGWFTLEEMGQLTPIFHEDLALFRSLTQSATKI